MLVTWVILSVIGVVLALLVPWFPSKASVQLGRTRTLYDVLLIATVPIFVLVLTVVLFSVWKFRMRPGQEELDGPPIHGNTRLEVVWTAVPALLILSMCGYAYSVLRANENSKKGEMTVNVTARQFAFEFSYPGAGKPVVSSELYLPINKPVVFKLRSIDVIHSFFVPNFSEKLDAVPGIVTTLRVTPTTLGVYPVECTELCGAGHSLMRTSAHVVSATAFATWLHSQPANAPPPIGTVPPNVTHADIPDYKVIPGYGPSSSSSSSSFERAELLQLQLVQLELIQLEHRDQRSRRQVSVHGHVRVQWLPHTRGRVRHRDGGTQPRRASAQRLRHSGFEEGPRRDLAAVHSYGDRRPLRLHPVGLQRRDHAVQLRPAPDPRADPVARQLPGQRGQMTGVLTSRTGIVQRMDGGPAREPARAVRSRLGWASTDQEVD